MPATLIRRHLPRTAPLRARTKVAYVMSQFPKLTETFVLNEMLAVERQGVDVEIYPLQRGRSQVMHAEARKLVERAHYVPWLSWMMLRSHLYFLRRSPVAYLKALARLLWANLGSLRYLAGAIAFFPKAVHLARQMQASGINHVHAHFASHPAAVAFVIHRLTGIPYSFTAHGSDLHRDRHMLREKVSKAEFVVAISQYNRQIILDECGVEQGRKVEVIHCGVELSSFLNSKRPFASVEDSRPLQILCIGTLHEVKGQTYLIEACRLLEAQGIRADCHFVGDGPDRERLQRQAVKAGLAERVHFHGCKPRDEVAAFLQQADVLVAPSVPTRDGRREGIPVVLMEAMASGVPVVASRLSGIPELVEEGVTGLLSPPGEPEMVARSIARLASDKPLRDQLTAAARQRIDSDFNLNRNAATLARHFSHAGKA